jgi:hypothetical protein
MSSPSPMGRPACGRRGKRMTCAGGGWGVVVEKVLHVEGCGFGQL